MTAIYARPPRTMRVGSPLRRNNVAIDAADHHQRIRTNAPLIAVKATPQRVPRQKTSNIECIHEAYKGALQPWVCSMLQQEKPYRSGECMHGVGAPPPTPPGTNAHGPRSAIGAAGAPHAPRRGARVGALHAPEQWRGPQLLQVGRFGRWHSNRNMRCAWHVKPTRDGGR